MPSIFMSYRRSDTGGYAGRLFDRLRCWYATEELFFDVSSVDLGDDFPEKIEQAIRVSKVILVIIGPDWIKSINERVSQPHIDFVRREVSIALERAEAGDARIFPILVGGAGMPGPESLHTSLKEELGKLSNYNAFAFPDNVRLWDFQFKGLQKSITKVAGVPEPKAQLSHPDGQLGLGFAQVESTKQSELLDVQAVQQSFGVVSTALLNWPQNIAGEWIARPELDELMKLTTSQEQSVTAILGEPGGGKSAILSRLGTKLAQKGVVLLAIKADQLPKRTATLGDLDDWIGCDVPATVALRELAVNHRVVVLIDQLDALSDLMDQHTERLGLVIRFVNSIRNVPNLAVVLSCREFEFRNDLRFVSLDADEVSLQRPDWELVESVLTARGFETSGWSEEVRDVLRTPQHLAMFLENGGNGKDRPLFTTYQGLLSDIVRKRLEIPHGNRAVEAAEAIAAAMADEEELWLARARFEPDFAWELERLEESGFLVRSENRLSIGFRHQTVFDFLRARGFLRNRRSLEEYVIEQKQQSLFVRPILWSTLNYLRASDGAAYRRQFKALWGREDLRSHVRSLLIRFLGHLSNPDSQEAGWLFPGLEEETTRSAILSAIAGSPGWFKLVGSRLAGLMTVEPEKAWEVTPILRSAASLEPKAVLSLVRQNWMHNEGYLPCALVVLQEIENWEEDDVELACTLLDYAPGNTFVVQDIAQKVSISKPDLAPRIVARYLKAMIRKLDSDARKAGDTLDSEGTVEGDVEFAHSFGDTSRPYQRLIDSGSDWHRIDDLARRSPKAFVSEIWPWLVSLYDRLGRSESPAVLQYRDHQGLSFLRDNSERQPLQSAIEEGIRIYAESESEAFLEFFHQEKHSDLRVLHRLLAIGLIRIAEQYPRTVLEYLLEDRRRFALGHMGNELGDSQVLIAAAVPSLCPEEAFRLERAIRGWTWYRTSVDGGDAKSRQARQKLMRTRRLRLLKAFPLERLSEAGLQYVRQEERAFPGLGNEDRRIGGGWVGSPMSSEQMERATDEQILALFDELTDDTGWEHPKRRYTASVGGSIQASREFANFASKSPERALPLIGQFQAGKTERPAGAALAELAKTDVDPVELIACVQELDDRGFRSVEFRTDAVRCLGDVARRAKGLNDKTCGLLESWIDDWEPVADTDGGDSANGSSRDIADGSIVKEGEQASLLWDVRPGYAVPQGNYPYLETLMWGYLCREPAALNEWLGALERHLSRREDARIWQEVSEDLWRLTGADRTRAIEFIDSLFSLDRQVFRTDTGVKLLAQVMSWLPRNLFVRIVDDWISGNWSRGPQAAGEVMALDLCRNPEDKNALQRVEGIVSGDWREAASIDRMRAGLTYTFVAAWSEAPLRAMATGYLLRLAKTGTSAVDKALSTCFSEAGQLAPDDHTRDLLEVLLERPGVLVSGGHFLIEGMKGLLRDGWRPDLVYRITEALIAEKAKELGDIRTAWAADAGELADIAVTLHRIPDTRELGLALCERLMDARSYGLDERIAKIDRLAFR